MSQLKTKLRRKDCQSSHGRLQRLWVVLSMVGPSFVPLVLRRFLGLYRTVPRSSKEGRRLLCRWNTLSFKGRGVVFGQCPLGPSPFPWKDVSLLSRKLSTLRVVGFDDLSFLCRPWQGLSFRGFVIPLCWNDSLGTGGLACQRGTVQVRSTSVLLLSERRPRDRCRYGTPTSLGPRVHKRHLPFRGSSVGLRVLFGRVGGTSFGF